MCKHILSHKGVHQPYYSLEMVSGIERMRNRGIMHQAVCAKCGLVLGIPKKSQQSGKYLQAFMGLAAKHNLTKSQRRLINRGLRRLDEGCLNRSQRESVFIRAIQAYSAISESEILTTVARI